LKLPSYEVIKPFRDKHTGDLFGKGDAYFTEDEKRVKYLQEWGYLGEEVEQVQSEEDAEEDAEEVEGEDKTEDENGVKHVGGGYYELPNGEKIKGKQEALVALAKMKDGE
jgi:hypothetical protein